MSAEGRTTAQPSPTVFPSWTTRVQTPRPTARYPLALEAVGAGVVAEHIFPGFTNATRQARYFSFLSWIFWTFDVHRARQVSQGRWPLAQRRWRVRLEHALRCCSQYHSLEERNKPARGLIGVRKTPDLRILPTSTVVELGGKRIAKIISAFDAAFYGSPFVSLRFGIPRDGIVQLRSIGIEAAQAFDAALRDGLTAAAVSALDRLLDSSAEVTAGELRRLAEHFRIRSLAAQEAETTVLLRVLFRLDSGDQEPPPFDEEDRRRCLGLARVLDVVGQSANTISAPNECHYIFACRRFKDGHALTQAPPLDQPDSAWQRYEERQHQKLAISAFWDEVLEFLESEHAPPRHASSIVSHCISLLERSGPLAEWLGQDPVTRTIEDAITAIMRRASRRGQEPMAIGYELTERIRNFREDPDATARLGRAVVSLLLAVGAWRHHTLTRELRSFHEQGGAVRLSLAWVSEELARRNGDSLVALIQWIVERCVLAQSIRVAYEKMDSAGHANRFFIEHGDGGYRIVQMQPRRNRLPYDAARLDGAFSLLRTLGLLRHDPEGHYSLTRAGRQQLRATVARVRS
jgi:hypothetical protein